MISTPFIIHDENSSAVPTKNKFLQKSTKLGPGLRQSPSKSSVIRNPNNVAPRKALGSITSNDLNTRVQQSGNVTSKSNIKGLNNSSINILAEKEIISKNSKVSSVQAAKSDHSKVASNVRDTSFHDDDMLCTRKPNSRSIATLDPYDYCMDLVATRVSSNDPLNSLIDYPPSSLSMQLSDEELKVINGNNDVGDVNLQVKNDSLMNERLYPLPEIDLLIPDYSLYTFEEPPLLQLFDNNHDDIEVPPLIIISEQHHQSEENDLLTMQTTEIASSLSSSSLSSSLLSSSLLSSSSHSSSLLSSSSLNNMNTMSNNSLNL